MPKTAFQWANLLFAAMFAASAVLQYNDPDPLRWILVYAAAAAACLFTRPPRLGQSLPGVVGALSLVWALTMLPQVIPGFRAGDLFRSMKAETPAIEQGREALGLLAVAAWMSALLVHRRRESE